MRPPSSDDNRLYLLSEIDDLTEALRHARNFGTHYATDKKIEQLCEALTDFREFLNLWNNQFRKGVRK